jgi:hypothetical protein
MKASIKYIVIVACGAVLVAMWSGSRLLNSNSNAASMQTPSPAPLPTCNIVLSSAVPHDVVIPKSHIGNPNDIQVDFDTLSWNTFIALNWPADPNRNGKPDPDPNKKIGLQDYSPVVWETYKESYDVFMADAKGNPVRPAAWNAPPQPPPGCGSNADYAKKLNQPIRVVKNISKDGLNEFLESVVMAPLTDQKGAFARYEILVNEDEFKHIMNPANPLSALIAPPLWDSRNQRNVNFPVGRIGGPEGPIEVKAAWKILGPTDNPARYHSEWIQIAWPTSVPPKSYKCSEPMRVGLIALHIAHKTFNAPQWAWSTFEQIDNYTPPAGSPPGTKASFNNPDCPPATCVPNATPSPPPSPNTWNGDPSVLNQAPPTQVVPGQSARVHTSCNPTAIQLLKSINQNTVWQYYRLVFTQWPQDPYCKVGQPCPVYDPPTLAHQGANQLPVNMANAVIETYLMGPPESNDLASCMACHNFATGLMTGKPLDFSFALQEAFPFQSASLRNLRAQRNRMLLRALGKPTGVTPK